MPLSRRAAHEALFAPAHYPPPQALFYGHLRASDAPNEVRDALLRLTRARDFAVDASWLKLFDKLARAPALAADQIAPLLQYASSRREQGASLDISVAALLRGMDRWQAERRDAAVRQRALQYGAEFDRRWVPSLGASRFEGSFDQGQYAFVELRSLRELFEEGHVMHHCVFGYAAAARAGTVSIWSLRIAKAGREVGRVTLRVVTSERAVVEARRCCNHGIRPHERELLRSWASSRGLSVAAGV